MLIHLQIENYILIDQLEIDFFGGFSVITGETGAGKSILLGALELILGNRADSNVLLDKKKKCTIEGTFQIENYGLEDFFRENELDYDVNLILRREISNAGKSRAFINDTPVNLPQMKDIGSRLVNIHSQNSTITLNQADFQLAVLDSFAGISGLTSEFALGFEEYKSNDKKLAGLLEQEEKAKTEEDYLRFQLNELASAQLQQDEQQQLEDELKMLSHAEEIKETLFHASQLLSSAEPNILGLLADVQAGLRKISTFHPSFQEILERLTSGTIEIKDIAAEISHTEGSTDFDTSLLANTQERLDMIYRLQSKHHVQTVAELLEIKDRLDEQLNDLSSLDEQISSLKTILKKQEDELLKLASILTAKRSAAIPAFEHEITGLILHMGMPHARFKVVNTPLENFSREGQDKIAFFFSANPGHDLKPLSEAASGGELSRVMLGIKAMISQKNLLPTIIFDEIDNGISGDIAGRVGDILLKTAARMQLIAITHLPQIAGKASVQYNVFKKVSHDTTVSGINLLSMDERIVELAKMISGSEVTAAARQTATELLNQVSIFDN